MLIAEARITNYPQLRKAIAGRRRALGLSQEAANDLAGLAGGHINKIECGLKCFGDVSLARVLGAFGLAIVLVPAVASIKPFRPRSLGSAAAVEMSGKNSLVLTAQQKGGLSRAKKLAPDRRSAIARKAALVRWNNYFKNKGIPARPAKPKSKIAKSLAPVDADRGGIGVAAPG
jgi:hypothetical protein